jgi:hypothetical protein
MESQGDSRKGRLPTNPRKRGLATLYKTQNWRYRVLSLAGGFDRSIHGQVHEKDSHTGESANNFVNPKPIKQKGWSQREDVP